MSRLERLSKSKLAQPTRSRHLLFAVALTLSVGCASWPRGGNPPPCEAPPEAGVEAFERILGDNNLPQETRDDLETLISTYARSCEALDAYRKAL